MSKKTITEASKVRHRTRCDCDLCEQHRVDESCDVCGSEDVALEVSDVSVALVCTVCQARGSTPKCEL
jgi:hypothetical protein